VLADQVLISTVKTALLLSVICWLINSPEIAGRRAFALSSAPALYHDDGNIVRRNTTWLL
jgi:hypothetical protein